ncbi:MAG: zf-TFIIB domain-containing protein [Cyanobacteria bacterium J06635_15]
MHCPICATATLTRNRLEEFLSVRSCNSCSGHWISSYDYWHWLEWHTQKPECKAVSDSRPAPDLHIVENRRAVFCPDCGHIMRKAKVGRGLEFYLDRCSHCGGFWFDQNKWELLEYHDLHSVVHLIFSDAWQAQIRQKEFKEVLEQTYRTALGDEGYNQAMLVKQWLDNHPHKDYVLSMLNQEFLTDVVPESEPMPEKMPITAQDDAYHSANLEKSLSYNQPPVLDHEVH